MTIKKSVHNADDAGNPNIPVRNTIGLDKASQWPYARKNTWQRRVSIGAGVFSFLLLDFGLFLVVYVRLSPALNNSSALLIACSLALLCNGAFVYFLLRQKVRRDRARRHMAKSKNVVRLQEKASTKKPDNRRTRLSPNAFDRLVQEAINAIPDEFQKHMDNLAILIEDEPDAETLKRVGIGEGRLLLGLYQGVPPTRYGSRYSLLPERITIYQRTIEDCCHGDPERIRKQVRKTVLHEVAHHFGMGHEEMPIWLQ